MKLVVTPTWSYIVEADPGEILEADRLLSRSNPHAFFARRRAGRGWKYQMSKVPSKFHFLEKSRAIHRFPNGLLFMLQKSSLTLEVVEDRRKELSWIPPRSGMLRGITLDQEQVAAVSAALENRIGHIHGATGVGKTEVMITIRQCLASGSCGALITVTAEKLLEQAAERAAMRGVDVCILHGNPRLANLARKAALSTGSSVTMVDPKRGPPRNALVVTTYQTLLNQLYGLKIRKKKIQKDIPASAGMRRWVKESCDLWMGDEIHLLVCDYKSVASKVNASYRIGVSGTPRLRGDPERTMTLKGWVGPEIYKFDEAAQVAKGRLARGYVWFRLVGDLDPSLPESLNWKNDKIVYRKCVVDNNAFADEVAGIAKWAHDNSLPCLVLVKWSTHADALAERVARLVPADRVACVTAKTKNFSEAKEAFEAGRLSTIVANTVMGVGTDFKAIRCLIVAGLQSQEHTIYQNIGRGIRAKEGSNVLHIALVFSGMHRDYLKKALKAITSARRKEKAGVWVVRGDGPLEVIRE